MSNDGADEERLCTQEVKTKSRSGNRNLILDIRIPEKDLLEFLPSKAYNMVS